MLLIGYPETSVRNYHHTLRNKLEECRIQPQVWIEDKLIAYLCSEFCFSRPEINLLSISLGTAL